MNRLNMFLLTALVLCALSLVNAQHQARQLFVALDRAQDRRPLPRQDNRQLRRGRLADIDRDGRCIDGRADGARHLVRVSGHVGHGDRVTAMASLRWRHCDGVTVTA